MTTLVFTGLSISLVLLWLSERRARQEGEAEWSALVGASKDRADRLQRLVDSKDRELQEYEENCDCGSLVERELRRARDAAKGVSN